MGRAAGAAGHADQAGRQRHLLGMLRDVAGTPEKLTALVTDATKLQDKLSKDRAKAAKAGT